MEVTITVDKGPEKELLIAAPWEAVQTDYNDLLKRYAKLGVKGFRPGKSPMAAVESCFGRQIKSDLVAILSRGLCLEALRQVDMEAGTPIEISDVILQKNDHMSFRAAFIEMPIFDLPDYGRLELEADEKDGKLDEVSAKLLERTNIELHPAMVEAEMRYSEEGTRDDAEARVKLMLILKKIASQDGIGVDEKDVEKRIGAVAVESDVSPEELKRFLIENKAMGRFADSLLAETVLDYIIEININRLKQKDR